MPLLHRRSAFSPVVLATCFAALGCIEDLDPKSVVRGPRILDIIADRPEVNPGTSTTLRVVLAGTTGTPTYRWIGCLSADATRNPNSLANFGEGGAFAGCFDDSGAVQPLGTNPTARFTAPPDVLTRLESASARFGSLLPPGALEALTRDIGITVGVAVEVTVDGVTLKGYKRVIVSANPRPNTNPPSPRVRVNDTWVSIPAGEGTACVPEDGSTLRAPRSRNVTLAPDSNEMRWVEPYRVLTASGQLVDRTETAFYSWYVSGGNLGRGLTQSPTRDNYWGPPDAPGPQTLWIFLRDGHGGTSWCSTRLTFE
jgi:hypothetical protein